MKDSYTSEIKAVVSNYFEGIYNGNAAQLKAVFHPETQLFGDINGEPYFKTATDYIEGVKNRKSPKDLDEDFKMKILSTEITGNNAVVKAHLPMLGFNYYDVLSMTKINGDWKIVLKLFTHID